MKCRGSCHFSMPGRTRYPTSSAVPNQLGWSGGSSWSPGCTHYNCWWGFLHKGQRTDLLLGKERYREISLVPSWRLGAQKSKQESWDLLGNCLRQKHIPESCNGWGVERAHWLKSGARVGVSSSKRTWASRKMGEHLNQTQGTVRKGVGEMEAG